MDCLPSLLDRTFQVATVLLIEEWREPHVRFDSFRQSDHLLSRQCVGFYFGSHLLTPAAVAGQELRFVSPFSAYWTFLHSSGPPERAFSGQLSLTPGAELPCWAAFPSPPVPEHVPPAQHSSGDRPDEATTHEAQRSSGGAANGQKNVLPLTLD